MSVYYPELFAQNFVDDGIKGTEIGKLNMGDLMMESDVMKMWKQAYTAIGYMNNIV